MLFGFVAVNLSARPQLVINGISPAYDSRTNTYLLSVSEQDMTNGWSAPITILDNPSVAVQNIVIDGVIVDGPFRFSSLGEGRSFDVDIVTTEGTFSSHLQFTSVPVLSIGTGDLGNEYTETSILWQEDGTLADTMLAKVKWRGGTTNRADKHKRNYKLSFVDASGEKEDHSFGTLRSDNQWILDAGQVDMFRMRNLIMAQLWNDFARKPYYIDQQPKALSATRGMRVELFVADQYQGIYNLCEPIDRKQMRLKKFDADGTIHGGLWKAASFGDATFWNIPKEYDNTLPKNDVWEVKYPEIEDLCPSDYTTLREAILFVVTSSNADFNQQVADYFDIPVMVDYYLFANVGNLFDICGKNISWAVYDKVVDKKLTPAMWDLDCSVGQNNSDDPLRPDYVAYDTDLLWPNNIFYRLITLNTNHFNEALRTRYTELRPTYFSTAALQQRFRDAYLQMHSCGALQREAQRWSGDSDIAGLTLDFAAELDYITQWIALRMDFLDSYFLSSAIEELRSDPLAARFFDLQGLPARGTKGLLIHNGKKTLIR